MKRGKNERKLSFLRFWPAGTAIHVHSLVSGVARQGCHESKGTRSRDNRARQLYGSLKRTVNLKPTEPKLMSVAGQRPPHSKLTTHLKIFRLFFDSRPKRHTKSLTRGRRLRQQASKRQVQVRPMTLSAGAVRSDTKRFVRDIQKICTRHFFCVLKPGSVLTGIMQSECRLCAFKGALNAVDGPKTTLCTGHKHLRHSPRAEIPPQRCHPSKNATFCTAPPFCSRGSVWPGFSV